MIQILELKVRNLKITVIITCKKINDKIKTLSNELEYIKINQLKMTLSMLNPISWVITANSLRERSRPGEGVPAAARRAGSWQLEGGAQRLPAGPRGRRAETDGHGPGAFHI